MIEVALRQRIQPVIRSPGIDHIGHEHGVVIGRNIDAAHAEDLAVELEILPDLEHACIFKQRLHGVERRALGDLIRRDLALEQAIPSTFAALPVNEWNIAGLIRRDGHGETAQIGLHRVETGGLRVDGDHAQVLRARDPRVESVQTAHCFVF